VAALWEQIQEVRVVHVRGTPSSGKSTLAGLLHMHVEKRGTKVIHFRWPGDLNAKAKTSSFSFALNEIIQEAGMTDQTWLSLENTLIIIDEAQVSYAYEDLWNGFIKPLATSGDKFGPYVVLFTSYGSPMGRVVVPTPYQLTCHQRMSIRPNPPNTINIGIFFSEEEFEDAVERFIRDSGQNGQYFRPSLDLKNYIWKLTSGHPAAVRAILMALSTSQVFSLPGQ